MIETAKQFLENKRLDTYDDYIEYYPDGIFIKIEDLRDWFFSRQKEIEQSVEKIAIIGATGIWDKEQVRKNLQVAAWREFCEALK